MEHPLPVPPLTEQVAPLADSLPQRQAVVPPDVAVQQVALFEEEQPANPASVRRKRTIRVARMP
jgi:hypothetical protein